MYMPMLSISRMRRICLTTGHSYYSKKKKGGGWEREHAKQTNNLEIQTKEWI